MIYDGHAYCFPPPARNGGFADPAEFWRHLQLFMAHARQQPCWRRSDRAAADASGLADPDRPWRFDGLRDAAFRTGDHGLEEWTVDGEDYVKQALPPWTVDFAFPRRQPGGGDGLRRRRPGPPAPHPLHGPERRLGRRLLPAASGADPGAGAGARVVVPRQDGRRRRQAGTGDPRPRPVGPAVRALPPAPLRPLPRVDGARVRPPCGRRWPGWRSPCSSPSAAAGTPAAYLDELRALRAWMDRFPDVDVVMTHGFPWRLFAGEDRLHVPDEVYEAAPIGHPRFHIQILFAVFLQSRWDYPMPQMRPVLETMVERIGADRIIWGTDIPIVLLHWTYRQSLDYVRRYLPLPRRGGDGGGPRRQHGAAPGAVARRPPLSARAGTPSARPGGRRGSTSSGCPPRAAVGHQVAAAPDGPDPLLPRYPEARGGGSRTGHPGGRRR